MCVMVITIVLLCTELTKIKNLIIRQFDSMQIHIITHYNTIHCQYQAGRGVYGLSRIGTVRRVRYCMVEKKL